LVSRPRLASVPDAMAARCLSLHWVRKGPTLGRRTGMPPTSGITKDACTSCLTTVSADDSNIASPDSPLHYTNGVAKRSLVAPRVDPHQCGCRPFGGTRIRAHFWF
jgi:hypothetical protein